MSVFAEFSLPTPVFSFEVALDDHPDVILEIRALVPTGDRAITVSIQGAGRHTVVEEIRAEPTVERLEVLDEYPDGLLVKVVSSEPGPGIIEFADRVDGRIVSAVGGRDGWTLTLRFPDDAALESFYADVIEDGLDLQLKQLGAADAGPRSGEPAVTRKQRETLVHAFEAGYFDIPRQVTLADIADDLGITEQGVSERLRRGLAGLLEVELDRRAPSAPGGRRDEE
ncbi:MAG: helix-turn-helix domain-containing protein [Halobacteriales archaeon]|nr:helix-turn-helix domain-containing protein [Halobacteriales archaeon]